MLRIGVKTGLLVAILLAVMKLVQARRGRSEDEWAPAGPESWPPVQDTVDVEPPAPVVTRPTPPVKKAAPPQKIPAARKAPAAKKAPATKKAPAAKRAPAAKKIPAEAPPTSGRITWVGPTGRICPPSHPVKAKLSSRIFHLPGMAAYNRTAPDRCYVDEASAVDDGFIRSKR